ncbi:hypothetical protein [Marinicella sp. W31]|uniref:hypothetical protein n=1 Tax=Marinicella sp. W31 TaxID=3023713 RepID=UPI0037569822
MYKQWFNGFFSSIILTFSIQASELAEIDLESSSHPYEVDSKVLVSFEFSNGNVVNFGALPEMDEMYIEEIVNNDDEVFVMEHLHGTILDKYLQITPQGTAVPQQLLDFEAEEYVLDADVLKSIDQHNDGALLLREGQEELWKDAAKRNLARTQALAQRNVVDAMTETVYVDLDALGINVKAQRNPGGQGSCNNSTGYLYFQEHHCNRSGSHGSGSSQTHCDYPMHGGIQRTSTRGMRSTYSRVANCAPGDAAIVHSKKTLGFFDVQKTWFLGVNQARGYETWAGKNSIRKTRRVNVLKVTPGGYVRGWTKFTRNSK